MPGLCIWDGTGISLALRLTLPFFTGNLVCRMSTSGTSSPEHKTAHDTPEHDRDASRRAPTRSRRGLVLGIAAAAIVVLALALGLGLGLGLHHNHDQSSASTNSSTGTSGGDGSIPSSLAVVGTPDASAAFLSMDIANAAPTTRNYDFVVEERRGAPDGVEKLMLVVNGKRS